jgi:hypothetical protein
MQHNTYISSSSTYTHHIIAAAHWRSHSLTTAEMRDAEVQSSR